MTTTDMGSASAFDVADYFIANADQDEGITNLKLQKLCSYAQAFFLALHGRRLFESPLEAWPHGPVIKKLYNLYRIHGKDKLSTDVQPGKESRRPFTPEQLFVLETVNDYYGRYAASPLRNMSHNDFPGDFDGPKAIIPDEEIAARFAGNKVIKTIREAYS